MTEHISSQRNVNKSKKDAAGVLQCMATPGTMLPEQTESIQYSPSARMIKLYTQTVTHFGAYVTFMQGFQIVPLHQLTNHKCIICF